jgi:hypothetical protein
MGPMNLICILSYEHQQNPLGCYGHPFVHPPRHGPVGRTGHHVQHGIFQFPYSCADTCQHRDQEICS